MKKINKEFFKNWAVNFGAFAAILCGITTLSGVIVLTVYAANLTLDALGPWGLVPIFASMLLFISFFATLDGVNYE